MILLRPVLLFLVLVLALVPWRPPPAAAQQSAGDGEWARTPQGDVRLIAAVTGVGESASGLPLGLHFRLKPHWKVYWRSPGDAGYPPELDWKGSDNLAGAAVAWPAPRRFDLLGIQTAGYEDEVVLPIAATPARAGTAMDLRLAVDFLVCERICIPQRVDVSLFLPQGPAAPSPSAHLIGRFSAKVPKDGAASGLRLLGARSDGHVLRVEIASEAPLQAPDMFVEGPDGLNVGAPTVDFSDGRRAAALSAPVTQGPGAGLAGTPVTVTVVDGERAMEAVTTVSAGRPGTAPVADFAAMLAVALLGGLVLNLMPCVLPVLSLKVLALIGHGGGESAQVRRSFIASAAGILFSFLVLAAATVAMKAAGSAVGWGIQFQHPLFLIIMVALLTLFAANLWGVFEFSMPHWMMGVGAGHGSPHSLGGHFLTGAFATLLSTPCTAPFLGTAIGFALARGPMEIVSIFTALGLGMASPYLAVAALPSLATRLPRPGRWMLRVKAFMGVLLAGTAVWLLTVLAALTGGGEPQRDGNWIPFDPSVLAREVAGGRNVFVDVTADWCVTCKVNKAAVIDRDEVTRRLREGGWIAMRADWTRPDDGIAAYLASFGRYGVPFNAVYGPGAPRGLALPELLTVDAVLAAMERASHQPETTP